MPVMRKCLIALCMLLAGCATTPTVVYRTKTVRVPYQVPIAPELLIQQPLPAWNPPYTWSSLAGYTIALQGAAKACQAQVRAIGVIAQR